MEIQGSTGTGVMKAALQQQSMGADLINKTLSAGNQAGANGGPAVSGIAADSQKAVLSAAYADQGKGTQVDTVA